MADSSWVLASLSEPASLRAMTWRRASSMEASKAPSSSIDVATIKMAVRPLPAKAVELMQTVPSGKCAAAMPV